MPWVVVKKACSIKLRGNVKVSYKITASSQYLESISLGASIDDIKLSMDQQELEMHFDEEGLKGAATVDDGKLTVPGIFNTETGETKLFIEKDHIDKFLNSSDLSLPLPAGLSRKIQQPANARIGF